LTDRENLYSACNIGAEAAMEMKAELKSKGVILRGVERARWVRPHRHLLRVHRARRDEKITHIGLYSRRDQVRAEEQPAFVGGQLPTAPRLK
jgi:hypothetical protein